MDTQTAVTSEGGRDGDSLSLLSFRVGVSTNSHYNSLASNSTREETVVQTVVSIVRMEKKIPATREKREFIASQTKLKEQQNIQREMPGAKSIRTVTPVVLRVSVCQHPLLRMTITVELIFFNVRTWRGEVGGEMGSGDQTLTRVGG